MFVHFFARPLEICGCPSLCCLLRWRVEVLWDGVYAEELAILMPNWSLYLAVDIVPLLLL